MKLDGKQRWEFTNLKEYLRQLSIGLITGGTIGFVFSPMPSGTTLFALLPLGAGIAAAIYGLTSSKEDRS